MQLPQISDAKTLGKDKHNYIYAYKINKII